MSTHVPKFRDLILPSGSESLQDYFKSLAVALSILGLGWLALQIFWG